VRTLRGAAGFAALLAYCLASWLGVVGVLSANHWYSPAGMVALGGLSLAAAWALFADGAKK